MASVILIVATYTYLSVSEAETSGHLGNIHAPEASAPAGSRLECFCVCGIHRYWRWKRHSACILETLFEVSEPISIEGAFGCSRHKDSNTTRRGE